MRGINKCMKTYTALVKARIGDQIKAVPTEIRAPSATDARWLLLAIYGFHALVSTPMEVKREMAEELNQAPKTPSQARIQSLQKSKDSAADALSAERLRQKRAKAQATLSTISSLQSR